MSNPFRLRSSDLFTRIDDDIKEKPLRIVFLSVEGNATEVDYFKHINSFKAQLGINAMVMVHVIRRANSDTRSDPRSVLSLLEELVDFHDNGVDASKFEGLLPPGYDVEFVRNFLTNSESISHSIVADFQRKMRGKGIDVAYLNFISRCDKFQDEFCVILDRDIGSHSSEQLNDILRICNEKGYKFFITSPCFEFWLLLHLCNVQVKFAGKIENIQKNLKVSRKHSFVSDAVLKMAGHSKSISASVFKREYLPHVDDAIKQAEKFDTNICNLINNASIGTNLADLILLLRQS